MRLEISGLLRILMQHIKGDEIMELKSTTKQGKKLERETKKGLDGFALMFANAIKYDKLAEAINKGEI